MKFYKYQFVVNRDYPSINDFTEAKEREYKIKNKTYLINIKKLENRFLWIYANFGKGLPYGADAFDEEQGGIVDNPRRKTQTELNNQIFSLYDFQNQTLFLQKDKDKTFLQEYFKEDIQKDCIIKRFFKTPQEFISNIVRVKKISFTSKTNLFTNEVGLFDNMSDIFGLGQPETFYISMDYKNKPVTENFAGCLESLVARKNNCEFDSLVVIGENDSKIESVFNIESYVESEDINIKTDENGMYNEILVMNSLIAKIKECENV